MKNTEIILFENIGVRREEHNGEWFFSVIDVIAILINQPDHKRAKSYWSTLKERLKKLQDILKCL